MLLCLQVTKQSLPSIGYTQINCTVTHSFGGADTVQFHLTAPQSS